MEPTLPMVDCSLVLGCLRQCFAEPAIDDERHTKWNTEGGENLERIGSTANPPVPFARPGGVLRPKTTTALGDGWELRELSTHWLAAAHRNANGAEAQQHHCPSRWLWHRR